MTTLKAHIVTPEGVTYKDENIKNITVTTVSGEITVYPRHMPLVSLLAPGEMVVRKKDSMLHLAVAHGVLEVRKENNVVILADRVEHAKEIDLERAQQARDKAREDLARDNLSVKQKILYERLLEKEENRVRVAERFKERVSTKK